MSTRKRDPVNISLKKQEYFAVRILQGLLANSSSGDSLNQTPSSYLSDGDLVKRAVNLSTMLIDELNTDEDRDNVSR